VTNSLEAWAHPLNPMCVTTLTRRRTPRYLPHARGVEHRPAVEEVQLLTIAQSRTPNTATTTRPPAVECPDIITPGPRSASVVAALVLVLSAGCGAPLHAQTAPTAYTFDAPRSSILVVTHRRGLLSFLGHDHAIAATDWSGHLCFSPEDPISGHGRIDVAAGALLIDTDSARARAGLGRGPSPGQIRNLQVKMLDSDHLDAANHPHITFDLDAVSSTADGGFDAEGRLTIRGRTREVRFPVDVASDEPGVRFRGVVSVPQSGFGIRPESIAGVIRVADIVDIHFDLQGTPTGEHCPRAPPAR
jgi:polyisoprenoid-binding protein YceI